MSLQAARSRTPPEFEGLRSGTETCMDDLSGEIEDIRRDIKTLRTMIDTALDNGADGDDLVLRASANVLYERRARLDQLERAAGFEAEGRDKQFS
jgi:hypothetical protein